MSSKHPKPGGGKPHTPHDENGAQRQQCKWNGDVRVTGEVPVKFPEDFIAEYKSGQKENATHNRELRLVTWLTFAAVVIYAGLTLWIACEAHISSHAATEAATAAQKQAKTSADQLAISERPWISSEVMVSSPFTFDINGANLNLEFALRNSGPTPAVQVSAYAKFVVASSDHNKNTDIKKAVCKDAADDAHISEVTIFPATEVKEARKFYISPEQFARFTQHGLMSLSIAVCIAYRSTVDRTAQYSTDGQIFTFARKGPLGSSPFIPGQDVPTSDLIFEAAGKNELLVRAGNYHLIQGDPSQISGNAEDGPINITLPKIHRDSRQQKK